jgi:hypothetical protein
MNTNTIGNINIPSKSGNATFSFITTVLSISDNSTYYTRSDPYNVFDLDKELSDRMNEYLRALNAFERCHTISQYVNTGNKGLTGDLYYYNGSNGRGARVNFGNDKKACNLFGNTTVMGKKSATDFSGNVFIPNGDNNSIYNSTGNIDYFPVFANNDPKTYYITGQYGVTQKNTDPQIGKNISQMTGDILNLMQNYSNILGNCIVPSTIQTEAIDNISVNNGVNQIQERLKQTFNKNLVLRNDLDQKVQAILGAKNSYLYDSKMNIDSTIYANIMWSILATTLIYFVLVKM